MNTLAIGSQPRVSFNRDIRPIFSNTCFVCHGPDKSGRKANLRLDVREEALKKTKAGVTPIVPGNPEESEIIRRIFATDAAEIMPPPAAHKTLSEQQKETIKRWVAEGAEYEGHWAYQPVTRPAPPEAVQNKTAIRNAIDKFIQARLAEAGMQAAPEADKRTLIRRVSLDLTGIPPTPQEIAAFLIDKSPDAYEKLVDRLLDSDRYAEKQTMHWLDAARYADTAGFHGDNAWAAWPYRDYVLRAFRDNKPFDEFTREQLAGDLLPNATNDTRIASAYNRINRVSAEGGVQPKEYLAKYAADRVRTASIVWLGSTMGCAECHDHKFDPFASKDFYAMKAFFADIKETGLVPDRGRGAFGSKLFLPAPEQQARYDELNRQLNYLRTELNERAKALMAAQPDWEAKLKEQHKSGTLEWKFQQPFAAKAANGTTLKIYNTEPITMTQYRGGAVATETAIGDGLVVASGLNPEQETYTVSFKPGPGEWKALGFEAVQEESLPATRLARGSDRFVISELEAEALTGSKTEKLEFTLATTDREGEQIENHPQFAVDGNLNTGWGAAYRDNNAFLALRLRGSLKTTPETVVTVRVRQVSQLRRATVGRFRLALSAAQYSWPDHTSKLPKPLQGLPNNVLLALATTPDKRSELPKQTLFNHFVWMSPELTELNTLINQTEAQRDLLESQMPRVMVTEAMTPAETRVLPRGNFLDESGEVVAPAIPKVFGQLKTGLRRATRLDLANWMVSKENPLTARVFVNRLWRQFFGIGLAKTLDDFGSQGEWPVNLALLDWLASEFMHPLECGMRSADCGLRNASLHDWDVKHIIRLIVTSHTYRQASALPDDNTQSIDSDNRLLAHQNRFRVDAEIVRDIALSVSGLLTEKFGGPSIRPIQPDGFLGALNFPKRDYAADYGAAQYRRGLYVHWQRTFLHPSLSTFDAPSREECTVNRSSSNTPLQALVLMNDPNFVEAARAFAQTALKQGATPTLQIAWAFERATGRLASAEEKAVLLSLYQQNLKRYTSDTQAAQELLQVGDAPLPKLAPLPRLAALTMVTRAILNLHETITRN